MAWHGNRLYVAETDVGLRVFDTRFFLDATKSPESADQGYRWVLPQVGMYRQNGTRQGGASRRSIPIAAGRRW